MKITYQPELEKFMTFEYSKFKQIYGWFWYKEGFSPELVEFVFKRERTSANSLVVDPFCGVGTTLLAAKQHCLDSIGVDVSPLAGFVSKVKTDDYSKEDIRDLGQFLQKGIPPAQNLSWDFELFPAHIAFPKRNFNEILAIREIIGNEAAPVRQLLLLALLSILPQISLILKDGGVLKIQKHKRAMPAKEMFKRKVKQMIRDLKNNQYSGFVPQIFLGDSREMDFQTESADLIVTSPPYLNNIDYSKIYGLELSLLHLSSSAASQMRMHAIRSFIKTGNQELEKNLPLEVGEIGYRIPIIGTYFKDMEVAIMEMFRILRPGRAAYVNISNSVIHETHVMVDEVFAEMAERIGFNEVEIVVGAERIADVKPAKVRTRESIVIMRK